MKFKSFALGGAAIVGLAVAALPAAAYTHHPSTPAEQHQTDDLNAQALTNAQGQPAAQTNAAPDQQAMSSAPTTAMESTPSNAQTPSEGPSSGMATAAASGTVSLAQVANSPQTLANASVETANGQAIGAVQKVVTGVDGKAQTLDIALLGAESKIVAIDAAQLSYDQSRNVVVAQLSADQIQALPPAPQG